MDNEDAIMPPQQPEPDAPRRKRRWAKRLGWAIAIVMLPVLLAAAFLSSPIGKRFVADQIAQVAPASGLRFEVGRIEGDIYGVAVLRDVVVKDPQGTFLTIPEVTLNWRPLAWLWSGLSVRELTARRATLSRLPELLPGDPDAPLLPDFDIRIDRFEIDNLTLAAGLAGDAPQRVNFAAQVDIRKGRTLVDAEGSFGPEDRIALLLDAEPDGDKFDLSLDYNAAADGPIAMMAGLKDAHRARVAGEGTWSHWLGHAVIMRPDDTRLAGFRITNDAGEYGMLGQVSPRIPSGTTLARSVGPDLALAVLGTLEDATFDGTVRATSSALDLQARGAVDLAGNRVDQADVSLAVRRADWLGETVSLEGARLNGTVDGAFRDLTIQHTIRLDRLTAGGSVVAEELTQNGTARFDGAMLRVPLAIEAARVVTGNTLIDPELERGQIAGLLTFDGSRLAADNARVTFPSLGAQLTLRGDTVKGAYALAGPVTARGLDITGVGDLTANSKVLVKFGSGFPWSVRANLSGVLTEIGNASVANLAGDQVRFDGTLGMAANQPLVLRDVVIASDRLDARLDSRITDGRTFLAGSGSQADYGNFSFDAEIAGEGPRASLVLANPLPAAGLKDVRVGIAPASQGFAIDVGGESLLGPFEGKLGLTLPERAPVQIAIETLRVYRTNVAGSLTLGDAGVKGDLALNGGGLSGGIAIAPGAGKATRFDIDLTANQARFGGATEIALAEGEIRANGSFGGASTSINGEAAGKGLQYGSLSIDNFAGKAQTVDGSGDVQASIAGRRSDRFALKLDGDFSPERIAFIAQGELAGLPLEMPRRAVVSVLNGGGYRLAPAQIGYAGGYTIAEGTFGADETAIELKLARMPLRIADLAGAELGLGGRVSGIVNWSQPQGSAPTANARIQVENFTRSGLVLSSRPIDLVAVADLSSAALVVGAQLRDDDQPLGRLKARIAPLAASADLAGKIMRGRLDAEFGYEGPAQSLWRLAAIETFDLTGPLNVSARATGSLSDPRITGTLSSDDLRLQSSISGTDITNISARGRFAGSRLELTRFSGATRGDGSVSGSGTVDLANMSASRGPVIDIRAATKRARLLNANGLDATITGPLRIVSNGSGGAIAGRVRVDRASWALGIAAEDMRLPNIATREINLSDQVANASSTVTGSWRYLVDAKAPSRVAVDGLGLDSEWGIDIALRGTVDDPRLGGQANLVRGDYTFAGTRFELTDGRIEFDANVPIDPRLDIEAQASANGTDVTIDITGNAQTPQIGFSSVPQLPEEEILARLLFGGSVTSLSATDAVQLGAALAALQGGGGGIDPIGALRRSIGLDQLRIVSADPAIGRGTGVALGKNIGRRVYIELITDGQGYSATQVEYRITRWLALLGTVTTIGRDSVLAEIRRDY